jgi:hypothetical protein
MVAELLGSYGEFAPLAAGAVANAELLTAAPEEERPPKTPLW